MFISHTHFTSIWGEIVFLFIPTPPGTLDIKIATEDRVLEIMKYK